MKNDPAVQGRIVYPLIRAVSPADARVARHDGPAGING
jgi:hypothetical protein